MAIQIALGRKSLRAYAAFVRLLTSVTAIVSGQMLFAVGVVCAVLALKPLRVVAMLLTSVLLQCLLCFEPFVAGHADMWGQSSPGGVAGLLMSCQSTLQCGSVIALITGKRALITVDALMSGQITLAVSLI